MRWALAILLILWSAAAMAQSWYEPARGTAERRALMDAIRPEAERIFGPPVEFVVIRLRVAGDRGFAIVTAQRPGGGAIDIGSTPGWQSGYFLPDADWTGGQALLVRTASGWTPYDIVFGATDVWWSDPALCRAFWDVIFDACP